MHRTRSNLHQALDTTDNTPRNNNNNNRKDMATRQVDMGDILSKAVITSNSNSRNGNMVWEPQVQRRWVWVEVCLVDFCLLMQWKIWEIITIMTMVVGMVIMEETMGVETLTAAVTFKVVHAMLALFWICNVPMTLV